MAERIMRAPHARKFIGKEVRWWPLRYSREWSQVDILHEVAGKNVRVGADWQWLPDIYMEPAGEVQP